MKLILVSLCLVGCASAGIRQNFMQPDGTYRIESIGSCFFTDGEDVIESSKLEATSLCGGTFRTKSIGTGHDGCHVYARLIVKCDN